METFIIAAQSADGFIAPNKQEEIASTQWTSKEDFHWFSKKTREAGVVVMGRKTWETIPAKHKPLKDRVNIIYTSSPEKIANSKDVSAISDQSSAIIPYTTSLPPKELKAAINDILPESQIAICGGTSIYTLFLLSGIIDKLYLTIEPKLFGQGTPLFDKPTNLNLNLETIHHLSNQSKVLEYNLN